MGKVGQRASPIQGYLDRLHESLGQLREGEVASYIPPLSKADPAWFSVCVATTDGTVYTTGDCDIPFTIQSISKPLVYGLALQDRGLDAVMCKVGVEPTGDAFNSIRLAPDSGRPSNPMVNAGAIATTSLVAGHSAADRRERLTGLISMYAGRPLEVDAEVFEAERSTGHRNRAIGHLLRNFEILVENPEETLDLYFHQCSVLVTCRDLAMIAGTLANGGVNPSTGETVLAPELVPSVLSLMTTCGMYDFAGEWAFSVGLPAKSGVAGGILAVLPGQLGIGVFSPPLDRFGNSVRGVAACEALSQDFGLHFLRTPRVARSALHSSYDLARVRSRRSRTAAERAVLQDRGRSAQVHELQGDLDFAAAEVVLRRIAAADEADTVVLDLKRVARVSPEASRLMLDLLLARGAAGRRTLWSSVQDHSRFLRFVEERIPLENQGWLMTFPDLDLALEWCERLLLESHGRDPNAAPLLPLADHPVCEGLGGAEIELLSRLLEPRRYQRGDGIVARDDTAQEFYLILQGEVTVSITLPSGQVRRLATLGAGTAFGELSILSGAPRSADVHADSVVECLVLARDALDRLESADPHVKTVLLQNLLRNAAETVERLTREVLTLSS